MGRDTIALVNGLRKRCWSALGWSALGWSALVASALAVIPMGSAHAGAGVGLGAEVAWAASLAPPAREAAPAAVVGLDTDAPEQGAALTRALRKAFAAREIHVDQIGDMHDHLSFDLARDPIPRVGD